MSVRIEAKPLKTYNLTVADFHTYFVRGAANDNGSHAPSVWVHNNCIVKGADKLPDVTAKLKTPQPNSVKLDSRISDGKVFIDRKLPPDDQKYEFVIDTDGRLHNGEGHYHLSGEADVVKSAGSISFRNGKIDTISSNSGHYQPNDQEILGAAKLLVDRELTSDGFFVFKK